MGGHLLDEINDFLELQSVVPSTTIPFHVIHTQCIALDNIQNASGRTTRAILRIDALLVLGTAHNTFHAPGVTTRAQYSDLFNWDVLVPT